MAYSWKPDAVIKLIDEYRKQEVLWKPIHPNFSNRILKSNAWKEIAKAMDMPEVAVRLKVENFSAQLRREKARIKQMAKRGYDYKPSWYGFQHLKFLINKGKYRKRSKKDKNDDAEIQNLLSLQTKHVSNNSTLKRPLQKVIVVPMMKSDIRKKVAETVNQMKKSVVTETQMIKSADTANHMINSAETDNRMINRADTNNEIFTPVDTDNQMTKSVDTNNQMIKSIHNLLASTSNAVNDIIAKSTAVPPAIDADQIFADFIATKLRMYSQQTKNVLQYEISSLLFQADTGIFDEDNSYATFQPKTESNQSTSQQITNDFDSSSPENKKARTNSTEDWSPIILKFEDNSDLEDLVDGGNED